MKRCFPLIAMLTLLTRVQVGGGPVQPSLPRQREEIAPLGQRNYVETFRGGQRACVIVLGSGTSALGLYVYDGQGNCVAWDDLANAATRDSLAVEWVPAQEATYTVQVRNLSGGFNQFQMAIR